MLLSNDTHTEERTVTIKVLRIGTKQFTSTLFKQIPLQHPIDRHTGLIVGTLYGRVILPDHGRTFVLWEKDGKLFRYTLDGMQSDLKSWELEMLDHPENDSLRTLLWTLDKKGIVLSIDESDKVHYKAPSGVMTPELVQAMQENKGALKEVIPQYRAYHDALNASYASIIELEQLFIGV